MLNVSPARHNREPPHQIIHGAKAFLFSALHAVTTLKVT